MVNLFIAPVQVGHYICIYHSGWWGWPPTVDALARLDITIIVYFNSQRSEWENTAAVNCVNWNEGIWRWHWIGKGRILSISHTITIIITIATRQRDREDWHFISKHNTVHDPYAQRKSGVNKIPKQTPPFCNTQKYIHPASHRIARFRLPSLGKNTPSQNPNPNKA